jgi:arylsulfatase A-like enzyme
MLTGYLPDTHRALLLNHGMDPAIPTLADRFRKSGFTTAALVYDCVWLSPRWGFGKGFDSYRVTRWRAGRQAMATANWMIENRDEQFFYFLHIFEPHSDFQVLPYEAPGVNRRVIGKRFGVSNFGCRGGLCSSAFLNALGTGEIPLKPKDREILRATYDAGVTYLDTSLGLLFDALRSSGAWDNLLVVVTSDHGEEFMEHGGFSHGTLHDEILRVPLLIKWPGGERGGVSSDALCSSIDLAPTLLEYFGLSTDNLPGVSLGRRSADEPVFAGTLARVVVAGGFKGIIGGPKNFLEVFDLKNDPQELDNLAASDLERVAELEGLLRHQQREAIALHQRIGSDTNDRDVGLSERERERLEAFGYLQGNHGR